MKITITLDKDFVYKKIFHRKDGDTIYFTGIPEIIDCIEEIELNIINKKLDEIIWGYRKACYKKIIPINVDILESRIDIKINDIYIGFKNLDDYRKNIYLDERLIAIKMLSESIKEAVENDFDGFMDFLNNDKTLDNYYN